MKRILLFMLTILTLAFATTPLSAQNSLTVADGTTTNSYVPIYGYYADAYLRAQIVYPESMLTDMQSYAITEMTFYLSSTPSWSATYNVKIGINTDSTLSDFSSAQTTTVYTGAISVTNNQLTVTLNNPFTYTGGHLLVEFATENTGGYQSASFYGISSTGSSVQGYSYSGVSSVSATQRNFIPKTTFSYGVPSLCSKPMNVTASNITTSGATISWVGDVNASSYTVQYMLASESDWTNALSVVAYDTTADLTGLMASSFYKARVQTFCSDNTETNWSSVCNFATACDPITITTAWTEDFESYAGSGEQAFNCWATPVSTPGGGPFVYCAYGDAAHSGLNTAELKGANNMLVLPEFTNTIQDLRLSFWATAVTPSNGVLEIGVLPDMDDLTSFEVVGIAGTPGNRGSSSGGNGNFMGPFYFGNATASSGRIALRYTSSGTNNSWNLDDFTVDMAPLCSEISNLQVSDVYGTNASLSWNPTVVGDVLEYNVYVHDNSTGADNVYTTSDTTYTIMGLNELTAYTVGVFTTCATATSDTVFTNFMTPCNSPVDYTVGSGTSTTYYFPTYSCYDYSYTQQIIPAAQLGGDPVDFASLFFQCTSAVSGSRNWNIYAALLPNDTNLLAGWILPSATIPFQLIHSGPVTITSTGTDNWFEVALDTVLAYDGTSNLLLSFQDMTGDYDCSNYYKYHSDATTTNMSRYVYRDGTPYNYANPDEAGDVSNNVNNIRFIFCDQSTCIRPNTLAASNVTETSADITWVSAGTESSWELEYKAAGDTTWTSEGTISATNHTLSNLTANTQYTVRVRALCGANDVSLWSEPISFRTECGPIATIPYSENFEDASAIYSTSQDNYYLCWNRYASNQDHFVYVSGSSSYAHGGSHFLDFHHTTNCYNIAIMPAIDQSIAVSTLMVNFWACRTGATGLLEVGVMSDYADASTFEPVDTIDLSAANTYQYVEQYVKFENYQGTGQYVAFRVSNANSCGYYIDDVVLDFSPECSEINSLNVSEISGTSALITWTDGPFGTVDNYTLEYSLAGGEVWNPITVDTTSYLLGNLEPSTYYDIRVMVNCDGSLSSDYVTTTFHTACLVGGDVTIGEGASTNNYLPSYSFYEYSYSQQLFLASELGQPKDIESVTFDLATYSMTRTYKIYLMHTSASSISSWIDASNAQLVFDASQDLHAGLNTFQFSTPFAYNGTDNLLLIVLDNTGSYQSSPYNAWRSHPAFSNASRYIYRDGSSYSISSVPTSSGSSASSRNNVIFGAGCDTTTSCVSPHINIASVGQTSATIAWVAGYQENAWEMEYRPQNDSVWTSVGTVTSMSEVINGLTPNTTYVVRMRSDCGGEYSYWTETSFTTECGALTVTATNPWTEGFEGYTGSNPISLMCWGTPATYTADNGTFPAIWGNWAASCHTGVNSVEMKGTNNVLVLPEFTNNLQELRLSFWATTTHTSNYGTMEVGVLTDPTDTSTFVVLGPAGVPGPRNSSNTVSGNGNFMGPFDFNNVQVTTGRIALRFMHTASGVSWNLDDFTVELIPDCPSPVKNSVTATNVDGHNATISFTDNDPDHNSWTVYYKPSTNTTWSSVVINTTTTTLTNLDPETTYDVYVVTNCATPDPVEDATITIHFTTLVACPAPTGITASNVGMTSATISWQGNADSYNITCGTDNLTSTTNSIELTGLTAGTSYTVTVVADCGTADGTSAPATFTFTTALCEVANQCAYTFVLTDTYGDGWNGGSLTVQQGSNIVATLEALHHGGGNVMSYDTVIVNLCDNQSTSLVWSAGSYASEPGFTLIAPDGTQAYTISGMTNYTTYTFTTDCGGSGPVVTNPTVATNAANPVAQTTATLNATITNPDNVTISAKGFEWKATMGGTYAPVVGTGSGNAFSATLSNLSPNTGYTYKAFITYNGTTVYGDEVTFTTQEQQQETCPAPTNLTAALGDPSHTTVTLTWQQEANTANEWQINYRQTTEDNWSTATVTSTTYTLTDLVANVDYEANVVAHCTNGLTSEASNTVTWHTDDVGIQGYLERSVTLYPNPATEMLNVAVSDANITITGVEVYNVFGQIVETFHGTSLQGRATINVSGLADGMYYVRVTTDGGVVTKNFVKR